MKAQAARLEPALQRVLGGAYAVSGAPLASQIGSGALPVDRLPSHGLAIRAGRSSRGALVRLEKALRALPRPVLGRLKDKALWLDLRCLEQADEAEFLAQLDALTSLGPLP
jgi:L-seryl-tRNA(Ser) seleniumtransferase